MTATAEPPKKLSRAAEMRLRMEAAYRYPDHEADPDHAEAHDRFLEERGVAPPALHPDWGRRRSCECPRCGYTIGG